MRFPNGLVGLMALALALALAVALAGCSGPAFTPAPSAATPSPTATKPAVTQTGPAQPRTKAGVHTAATNFYRLSSVGQFAASWDLLTPTAQQAIPLTTWVAVHKRCSSAAAQKARVIRSVLVFGNAAIVTQTIAGARARRGKAHDVFSYANGHWAYAPNDLSIYQHGSVAADVAAAKAQGLCPARKASQL
jgi:hypothetical protein